MLFIFRIMTILTTFFAVLGACYVSWLITKFIIWLDGADKLNDENAAKETEYSAPAHHRAA